MVVSKWPCSLSAMAPSAQSEWMPTKSGSMPFWCSNRSFTTCQIVVIIISAVADSSVLSGAVHGRSFPSLENPTLFTWN
eukprot:6922914-Ditylum_brightwellii.AAC.1